MTRTTLAVYLAVAVALAAVAPAALQAQMPRRYKNLKVLPADTRSDSLRAVMHEFSNSLGVRCDYCHAARTSSMGRDSLVFELDEKPAKDKARFMMRMVAELNATTLAKLPHRSSPAVQISCITCHRGSPVPQTIDKVIAAAIDSSGVEAGIQRYRTLRAEAMEEGRYDFTEGPVSDLAHRLSAKGKTSDALALLAMNADIHPSSSDVDVDFGDVYRAAGDTLKAVTSYKKALEKEPRNFAARRRLDELTGAAPKR